MDERPYTPAQQKMMKVSKKKLTEKDLDYLRTVLLPRSPYLPKTEEECFALAEEMLGKERYEKMCELLFAIEERFCTKELVWTGGDKIAELYCRVKRRGRTFCAFAITVNKYYLAVYFNAAERDLFEKEKTSFPVKEIRWPYNICGIRANGVKRVLFDVMDEEIRPHIFPVLDLKVRAESRQKSSAPKK